MARYRMANRKGLLFLSYNEDIVQNRLLWGQFLDVAMAVEKKEYDIHVLSFLPISRMRLLKPLKWLRDFKDLKNRLISASVHFGSFQLWSSSGWLYTPKHLFSLVHNACYNRKLASYLKKNEITYIYCRGYHAALAAIEAKRISGSNIKIHFDPRGLFASEGQFLKRLDQVSANWWLEKEKFIVKNSDLLSFVSKPFETIFKQRYGNFKSFIMHTHVNTELILPTSSPLKPLKLCYVGQLDHVGWHRIDQLLNLTEAIAKSYELELRILTHSDHYAIREAAKLRKLSHRLELGSSSTVQETNTFLADCHFGLLSYRIPGTTTEKELADTVIAAKSGEYLAAGLPIICNELAKGIADLIEEHAVGINYLPGEEAMVGSKLKTLIETYPAVQERCRTLAMSHFSLKQNAKLLGQKIDQILGK